MYIERCFLCPLLQEYCYDQNSENQRRHGGAPIDTIRLVTPLTDEDRAKAADKLGMSSLTSPRS